MKKIFPFLLFAISFLQVFSQTKDFRRFDTTYFLGEVYIQNHTKDSVGAVLKNMGNGRLAFGGIVTRINDSMYKVGVDTILIKQVNATVLSANAGDSGLSLSFVSSNVINIKKINVDGSLIFDQNPDSSITASVNIAQATDNALILLPGGLYVPNSIHTGIVFGGVVTHLHDYVYDISASGFYLGDVFYMSPEKQVTLATADPSLDRIDDFVLTSGDSADVVTGIPASPALEPSIDVTNQIKISFAKVGAGTTAPTIDHTCIYVDNAGEYTAVSSNGGRLNPNATASPINGSHDIQGIAARNGDNIKFTRPGGTFDPRTLDTIFTIKILVSGLWGATSSIDFRWRNATTNVGGRVRTIRGTNGFNDLNTTSVQIISFPMSQFGLPPTTVVDNLLITVVTTGGRTINFKLDDICMQGQSISAPVTGNYVANGGRTPKIITDLYANLPPAAANVDVWFLAADSSFILRSDGTVWHKIGGGAQKLTGDARGTIVGNTILDTVYNLLTKALPLTFTAGTYLYYDGTNLKWDSAKFTTFYHYWGATGFELVVPSGNKVYSPLIRDSSGIGIVRNADSSLTFYSSGIVGLSNGNATTASGSHVDIGGIQTGDIIIRSSGGAGAGWGVDWSTDDFKINLNFQKSLWLSDSSADVQLITGSSVSGSGFKGGFDIRALGIKSGYEYGSLLMDSGRLVLSGSSSENIYMGTSGGTDIMTFQVTNGHYAFFSIPLTTDTGTYKTLVYDPSGNQLRYINIAPAGAGTGGVSDNFANTNLTQTGNRQYDGNGHTLSLTNNTNDTIIAANGTTYAGLYLDPTTNISATLLYHTAGAQTDFVAADAYAFMQVTSSTGGATINIDTASGGSIYFADSSLNAASNGYVWTLVDQPNARGAWRAASIQNIGNTDLTITGGARTLDGGGNNLIFQNMPEINLNSSSGTVTAFLRLEADDPSLGLQYQNTGSGITGNLFFGDTHASFSISDGANTAKIYLTPAGQVSLIGTGVDIDLGTGVFKFDQPLPVYTIPDTTAGMLTYIDAASGELRNVFWSDLPSLIGSGGSTTFAGLTDVTITSPADGQYVQYNAGSGKWVNATFTNAAADGSTKGIASFTANDFNSSGGNISLDYTNAQAADASHKGFLTSADWTTFNGKISGNQTITLSGDISGSGTTAITTTIGASKVTNAMLAGSIAASKLVGSDIATVGTITTGTWQSTKIGLAYGGTNADLSATGGAGNYLKQVTTGAAITVGTIPESDLTFTNITTNNVSTSKHGFVPILPNDATKYFDGTGAYSVPAGTYSLPTASPSVLGGVKVDNTTIGISSGVISALNYQTLQTFGGGTLTQRPTLSVNTPLILTDNTVDATILSIQLGSTSNDGYISHTAFTTFNNKAGTASPTFTGSPLAPTQTARDNSTKLATTAYVDQANNDWEWIITDLGSTVLYETPWKMKDVSTSSTMVSNSAYFFPIYIQKAVTLTGIKFNQQTSGVYTSNNTNQLGLYTYSAGVITLVASSTDDGTMWKSTASATISKAFSSTYAAVAGTYYIGFVWNSSATTTAPTLGAAAPLSSANTAPFDLTNSAKISCVKGSSNSLPSPVTLSTTTNSTFKFWAAVY